MCKLCGTSSDSNPYFYMNSDCLLIEGVIVLVFYGHKLNHSYSHCFLTLFFLSS